MKRLGIVEIVLAMLLITSYVLAAAKEPVPPVPPSSAAKQGGSEDAGEKRVTKIIIGRVVKIDEEKGELVVETAGGSSESISVTEEAMSRGDIREGQVYGILIRIDKGREEFLAAHPADKDMVDRVRRTPTRIVVEPTGRIFSRNVAFVENQKILLERLNALNAAQATQFSTENKLLLDKYLEERPWLAGALKEKEKAGQPRHVLAKLRLDLHREAADAAKMREEDPDGYKLELLNEVLKHKSRQVAKRYESATTAEARAEARKELGEVLNQLFDVRERQKTRELEKLKKEVARLEEVLAGRRTAKERLVERRLRKILGEEDIDDW